MVFKLVCQSQPGTALGGLSVHGLKKRYQISDPGRSSQFSNLPGIEASVYKAGCLEVGSIFFSTDFIFIKTQITRRQCLSNRDLKRKRKGLWEVKLLLQLNSGFYGNKGCFVWQEPLPPPTAPDNVFVWPTFLLLHSSSLPPSVSSNNTHCHRSRKEIKTHSIWAELNHEAGKWPGRWELAFAQRTGASCFIPGLLFCSFFKRVRASSSPLFSRITHTFRVSFQ